MGGTSHHRAGVHGGGPVQRDAGDAERGQDAEGKGGCGREVHARDLLFQLPELGGGQEGVQSPQAQQEAADHPHDPPAEAWAGMRLLGSSVYGIRRYTRGAWLATHLDQLSTHVISAIINVGQKGNPWPLYIKDHAGETHKVYLEPGQVLWYESARLPHGRPEPFQGELYDNVFVHFKPASKQWHKGRVVYWERGDTPQYRVRLEK